MWYKKLRPMIHWNEMETKTDPEISKTQPTTKIWTAEAAVGSLMKTTRSGLFFDQGNKQSGQQVGIPEKSEPA
jgi:hypothetical protein